MGRNISPSYNPEVTRYNAPNLFAANRQLAKIFPVVLAYSENDLKPGQVLARNNVSNQCQPYTGAGASGLDTAACILLDQVDANDWASTGDTRVVAAIFAGDLYKAKLTGLDSDAITDLKAKTVTIADGTEILSF